MVSITSNKIDRYGRIVGLIRFDGEDINLKQIEGGMAWHYKKYEREQTESERVAYATAELKARGLGRGLWADPSPIPPWYERATKRSNKSPPNSTDKDGY